MREYLKNIKKNMILSYWPQQKPCEFDVKFTYRSVEELKVTLTGFGFNLGYLNGAIGKLATSASNFVIELAGGNPFYFNFDGKRMSNYVNNYLNKEFDCNLLSNLTSLL